MILSRLITPAPDRSLGHLVQQKWDSGYRVDYSRPAEGRPRPKVTIMARASTLQSVCLHFFTDLYAIYTLHNRKVILQSFWSHFFYRFVCTLDFT